MITTTRDGVRTELAALPRGARVFVGGYANHPAGLAADLIAVLRPGHAVRVIAPAPLAGAAPLSRWPGPDHGHLVLPHPSAEFADALGRGWASYWPVHLSDLAGALRDPAGRLDAALVQVAPPDADGRCHLGLSVDIAPDAVGNADLVVAEVNPHLPRPRGDSWIAADRIDLAVPGGALPVPAGGAAPSAAERRVAARVAQMVPDGATVQLGIGRLMDAVADELTVRRGLRLHTGLVTDGVVRLLRSGAVPAPGGSDPGPVVATMALGGRDTLAAVHDDPLVELHPVRHTHDAAVLAAIPRLFALNTALEIGLDGSVGAEAVGGRLIAAVGGLGDFARGAHRSPGGRSVLALTSTTSAGRSRIAPVLSGPTTLPRSDAGWVVTEYGAVDLRPLALADRAAALIELAHPRHRAALRTASEVAA